MAWVEWFDFGGIWNGPTLWPFKMGGFSLIFVRYVNISILTTPHPYSWGTRKGSDAKSGAMLNYNLALLI